MNQVTLVHLQEAHVEPLLFGAKDAARLLGISERTLWDLTKQQQFDVVRVGSRTLWSGEDLRNWVQQNKQQYHARPRPAKS